jgi:hypothetical protein
VPSNIIKHHSVDMNVPIGCGGVAVYPPNDETRDAYSAWKVQNRPGI